MTIYQTKYFLRGDDMYIVRTFTDHTMALAHLLRFHTENKEDFQLAIMYEMRDVNGEFIPVRDWRYGQ